MSCEVDLWPLQIYILLYTYTSHSVFCPYINYGLTQGQAMYHPNVHISNVDRNARMVLDHYPALFRAGVVLRVQGGGFSGADLCRLDNASGSYCLRAWPAGALGPERLAFLHRLMATARDSGPDCVPRVLATSAGGALLPQPPPVRELPRRAH